MATKKRDYNGLSELGVMIKLLEEVADKMTLLNNSIKRLEKGSKTEPSHSK